MKEFLEGRFLALDASGPETQVALIDQGLQIQQSLEMRRYGQASFVPPLVQTNLGTAGWAPASLDGIICAAGPGSFTGLRASLAFAKGLALGLDIPCYAIPSFHAYAASCDEAGVIVLESWREELFWCPSNALDQPAILNCQAGGQSYPSNLPRLGSALVNHPALGQGQAQTRIDFQAVVGLLAHRDKTQRWADGPAVFLRAPDVDKNALIVKP